MYDALQHARWQCRSSSPDAFDQPADLPTDTDPGWLAVNVPGTAASALRAAGEWSWETHDADLLDGRDWWWRGVVAAEPAEFIAGPWCLELDGLATVSDVWLNGEHLIHSENMHRRHSVVVSLTEPRNELVIRCASLKPLLDRRPGRPRWRSRLVSRQSLRLIRTSILGRVAGWSASGAIVGPWRPVRLRRLSNAPIAKRSIHVSCDDDAGVVDVWLP